MGEGQPTPPEINGSFADFSFRGVTWKYSTVILQEKFTETLALGSLKLVPFTPNEASFNVL